MRERFGNLGASGATGHGVQLFKQGIGEVQQPELAGAFHVGETFGRPLRQVAAIRLRLDAQQGDQAVVFVQKDRRVANAVVFAVFSSTCSGLTLRPLARQITFFLRPWTYR